MIFKFLKLMNHNGLRQLPGGFVSLSLATPNPTVRVGALDLREQVPGQLHALLGGVL